jgi:drug/metabolite transporter (DMT)-like permease
MISSYIGEGAALGAALIWAIASVIYTRIGRQLSPLVLNLVKGLIAIVLLIFTLALSGQLLPPIDARSLIQLVLSGVIGIGIGDTVYFVALNRLGARHTLVLESLSPPLTALLSLGFLNERLSGRAWLGIGLTVAGVLWVVLERSARNTAQQADGKNSGAASPLRREWLEPGNKEAIGIACGLLAAIGQATGAVLSRSALAGTEINPLWSTLIRLVAGVLVLGVGVGMRHRHTIGQTFAPLRSLRLWGVLVGAAFLSTYLGITLQQISLKYAPAGIAQALSATSPLFVIPMVMALGEPVSSRGVVGVLGAIVGIWLLFSA